MSFNRLLLRIAAVSAVSNFWKQPWPTLAGGLVFDSKVEPIENMEVDTIYPTIVVYTDYDKNHVPHQGISHGERTMTVTFELLMAVLKGVNNVDDSFVLHYPTTDAELEASLDVMESQLFAALRADNSAARCFTTMAYSIDNVVSRRGATTEGGTKIAARQVTYEAKVLQEWAAPTLPPYAEKFFEDLEASEGMDKMAQQVQSLFLANNAMPQLERLRQTMGWSTDTYQKLGYASLDAPVLPPNVVWLDQNGNPL